MRRRPDPFDATFGAARGSDRAETPDGANTVPAGADERLLAYARSVLVNIEQTEVRVKELAKLAHRARKASSPNLPGVVQSGTVGTTRVDALSGAATDLLSAAADDLLHLVAHTNPAAAELLATESDDGA